MTTELDISTIDDTIRARKDYGDLTGLSESLKNLGSIHPIVVSLDADGKPKLVAGGRRLRAAKESGFLSLHHGSILEPGKVGFLFREEVSEEVLKEAELDENLFRLKTKWQEDCVLIDDVHRIKQEKYGKNKWGMRQTAEVLGPGYGRTKVSYATILAKLIRAGDEDVLSAPTMSDAIAVLTKRQEDKALKELQTRTLAVTPAATSVDLSSFLDQLKMNVGGPKPSTIKGGDVNASPTESGAGLPTTSAPTSQPSEPDAPILVPLSTMFQLGDFQEVCSNLPDACIDHIVTDIPYGIDMSNMDTMKNIADVEKEHEVQVNVDLMKPFLEMSFRLVKSGGFCVFFYDLDWHEYLQASAEVIGWKVQRWPLIAYKTSACQNNAAQYNFTKNYECAMVLRRDEKTVLRSQQPTSVWMGDFAAERRLYNNPFAKPFELWKWVYNAIAFPGQKVFDPFCGEMSACRAAVNCGLQPFGCEVNEKHYLRGLEHMKAVYALLYKSNVQFT